MSMKGFKPFDALCYHTFVFLDLNTSEQRVDRKLQRQ